ncbi:helix-turn-helix domain-containing protein [Natronolimnohabitans innermongolicus]|uniref:DNA binding protein n=1 Tax=Natronolimnohabitans innermongolicus JCM 12255 TaxID=1227499 RepID=L9WX70_9EURY|nr:helix-turn-helix domain-containing protein [Natronolimnohabitans innermongolicus]ELY54069.1 DNA binding protein [Natronolimnohabitans innermongolicus JCM 12255]
MATAVVVRLPLAEIPLGAVLERDFARRIEFERVVPSDGDTVPFFWLWDVADDGVEEAIRETEMVRSLEEISRTAAGRLYRAEWSESIEGFVRSVGEIGVTITAGNGTSSGWEFELRFADREQVRTFQTYCEERGVDLEIVRIYTVREGTPGAGTGNGNGATDYGLTDEQRETLQRAYAEGYFDRPRGVTQSELAEEFGVGQRSISSRLRHGLGTLVGSTVAAGLKEGEDGDGSE